MALTIVRNDIVKMRVDAIVNSTNEYLQVGGLGIDAGIHYAAGTRLAEALSKIGKCPTGSAVITESFNIPTCKYIIHTVGPLYVDGKHNEEDQLRSCYRSVLRLAREKGCRSLAIPLLSAGAYRYPKAEAYRIATTCVREFLFSLSEDEDMMIYLVLFDRTSYVVGGKVDAEIPAYIDEEYRKEKKSELFSHYSGIRGDTASASNAIAPMAPAVSGRKPVWGAGHRARSYAHQDLSFAEMCEWWCEQKGISKKEFYISANINKAMFWNMKHHPEQIPKKTNVLACAIGLKLDYDQTQDLLMRAGMTLTKYYALDTVVEEFIRNKEYDIYAINEELFERDHPLLGAT